MRPQTESDETSSEMMRQVCVECGAQCCKYGGAIATELEVQAIVDSGYEDHFERIAANVLITEWGEEGVCPYLVGSQCSIYEVRPFRCRAYPVVQFSSGEVLVARCPLLPLLSAAEIERNGKLLARCPPAIVRPAARYMERHRDVLAIRSSRFEKMTLEEAIAERHTSEPPSS